MRKAEPLVLESTAPSADVRVVRIRGDVWDGNFTELGDRLNRLFEDGVRSLAIDLSGLLYIGMEGVGELTWALGRARENGGDVILAGGRAEIREEIAASPFGSEFTLVGDVDEALALLAR